MDPGRWSLGRPRGILDSLHRANQPTFRNRAGNAERQPGNDRTGRMVDRCSPVWTKAASSTGTLEVDKPALDPYRHRMSPIIRTQLGQDVCDVVLYSFLCDGKFAGDLSIAITGRDQT